MRGSNSNCLFFSTRALLRGFESSMIFSQFSIAKTLSEDIDLAVYTEKNDGYYKNAIQYGGFELSDVISLNAEISRILEMDDAHLRWRDIYDILEVDFLSKYDFIYTVGGLYSQNNGIIRGANTVLNRKVNLKRISRVKPIISTLMIHKAHVKFGIPLHEMVYEAHEQTFSAIAPTLKDIHSQYHVYDIERYNLKRLDTIQFNHSIIGQESYSKTKEFVFGYTNFKNGNRWRIESDLKEVVNWFDSPTVYVKSSTEDNGVSKAEYLAEIGRSKYTYLIPSYEEDVFSCYRFIEAVMRDCLPIIHPNVRIEEMERSFGMDLKPLLQTNISLNETTRIELLSYYKDKLTANPQYLEHGC